MSETKQEYGSQFYDDKSNFERYERRRQSSVNANDTLEHPVMLELLGEVKGARVLDLGCGFRCFYFCQP